MPIPTIQWIPDMSARHLFATFALVLGLGGCAAHTGPYHPLMYRYYANDLVVQQTPPPFVIEAVGSRPGQVWAHSYARWDGHGFVTVPGHWIAARPDYRYVNARWKRYHDGWHFKPAYWVFQ
jgi:hypothetical protein